jgi:RNA polymerase sigma-70 factor, ECF subfamily
MAKLGKSLAEQSNTRATEGRQCRTFSSEAPLLGRLREGDPLAFEQINDQYGRRLYRLALKILRNVQDAEDAVQETFLLAFAKIDSFAARSSLATWLTSILVNCCLMQLRKGRRNTFFSLDEPTAEGGSLWVETLTCKAPPVDESLVIEEQFIILREVVSHMRPDFRAILSSRYENELSMAAIAAQLDLTIPAAKSRASRARQVCARNMREITRAGKNVRARSARLML